MTAPTYFRNFPNIDYALRANGAGRVEGIKIKDYFNLLKVRSDIFREDTLYSPYRVKNGQRPDQISYEIYGDEQFYWIILQINDIYDYYNEWPLSEDELTAFVYKKYGGAAGAGQPHHYETVPVYNAAEPPDLLLPGGLVVPENYVFTYPTLPGTTVYQTSTPVVVTNYQYERRLNDRKSQIYLLDKKYIWDYERDVRNYALNLNDKASFIDISNVLPSY